MVATMVQIITIPMLHRTMDAIAVHTGIQTILQVARVITVTVTTKQKAV
jgi:hypothetical protein